MNGSRLSLASEILRVAPISTQKIKRVVECPGFYIEIAEVLIADVMLCCHMLLPGGPVAQSSHHVMIGRYVVTIPIAEIAVREA